MPVAANDTEVVYIGNGATSVFPFSFEIQREEDIVVYWDGAVALVNYTVSGVGSPSGGSVTFAPGAIPANGVVVVIARAVAYERSLVDYQPNGAFSADTVDFDVDRVVMMVQQHETALKRTPQIPVGSSLAGLPLTPTPLGLLQWNGAADAIVATDVATLSPGSVAVTAYAQTLLAAADEVAARTLLREGSLFTSTPINVELDVGVGGSGTLLVALKGHDGNDHSPTNVGYIPTRPLVGTNGAVEVIAIDEPLVITIPNGATLGRGNDVPFRVWVAVFISAAGVPSLGVMVPVVLDAETPAGAKITNLDPIGVASSFAISTSADNAGAWYVPIAIGSRPYAVVGHFTYSSGLGTAGNYASGPSQVQTWAPGMPLPGDMVQSTHIETSAYVSGTTTITLDDNYPTPVSWGNVVLTGSHVTQSLANVHRVRVTAPVTHSANNANIFGLAYSNNNLVAMGFGARYSSNPQRCLLAFENQILANNGSSGLRIASNTAGTIAINGSGLREFGGAMGAHLIIEELMG